MISYLSNVMIPMVIFGIIFIGLSRKIDMFAAFTEGAKDGFKVVFEILPTLIGLLLAVGVLRTSGILDLIGEWLSKPLSYIGFPSQLVPLSLVKMFSSSAATGLLLDIFKKFGTDSEEGMLASILMSCSETIFYTISVYFLATGNEKEKPFEKTGWILPGA
ncbi:nucleoside recognition domain-containing protein, partial [Butyribacter sp.]|uniref:nucleoside recognition domain-containing protein n=1 Tax=Butyribacter sp. TaxID=2822465 RepID=UPI002A979FC7|nr:spore maturation protein [Butyribacter sp.]